MAATEGRHGEDGGAQPADADATPDFLQPQTLWTGPLQIAVDGQVLYEADGEVTATWGLTSSLRWTIPRGMTDGVGGDWSTNTADWSLVVAGQTLPTFRTLWAWQRTEGVINEHGRWLPAPPPQVQRLSAYWLSLPDLRTSRAEWEQQGWSVAFERVPPPSPGTTPDDLNGVTATHTLDLRRSDGRPFTLAEVTPMLTALRTAVPYMVGRPTAPALVRLHDDDRVVSTEWGIGPVQPRSNDESWWNPQLDATAALPPLVGLLLDDLSGPTAERLLRTAVSANIEGYLEARVVQLVTALDQLAWHRLVLEPGLSPPDAKKINDETLAWRLRKLLTRAVVSEVPPRQAGLRQQWRGWDRAKLLAEVRNDLIHPKSVQVLDELTPLLGEAWRLAQQTLDECLLSWAGYGGEYSERTDERRWRGTTVPAPWAAPREDRQT